MIILVSKFSKVYKRLPLKGNEKIAYIANAKDEQRKRGFTDKYMNFFSGVGFDIREVDLRKFDKDSLYEELIKCEIIYVAGGNTFHLLEVMHSSGFIDIINDLLDKGIIYLGESAGAVVMGPTIEPMKLWDKIPETNFKDYNGLGFVGFVFLPHSDDKRYEKIIKKIVKEYGDRFSMKKFTDEEGVIIEGESVREI